MGNKYENPTSVLCGQRKIATTSTAVALGSGHCLNGVVITAWAGNTNTIVVGGSGVTNTTDGTGNGYRLAPGQSISFAVADISTLYINGAAGDSVDYAGN